MVGMSKVDWTSRTGEGRELEARINGNAVVVFKDADDVWRVALNGTIIKKDGKRKSFSSLVEAEIAAVAEAMK